MGWIRFLRGPKLYLTAFFSKISPYLLKDRVICRMAKLLLSHGVVATVPLQVQRILLWTVHGTKAQRGCSAYPGSKIHKQISSNPRISYGIYKVSFLSLRWGEYLAFVDIQDAYLHIQIYHPPQHFLCFAVGDKHLHFIALEFGLSSACRVFTKGPCSPSCPSKNWPLRLQVTPS